QWSPDRAWSDSVRTDALLRKELRQTCRKVLDRAFGRGIGEQGGVRYVRIDGCRVDDRAAFLHVRNGCFRQIEHRVDIDPEGELPLLVGNILDRFEGGLVGGIVDENVYGAELLDSCVDDFAAMSRRSDIAGDE